MSIATPGYSLIVCLVSLAAGLLGGMLGMAAGIFIVPALTLMFGVDIRHAVGTAWSRSSTDKGRERTRIEAIRPRRSRCSSCETRLSGASGCRCRSA